jgi:hypothetical protein
MSKRKVLIRRSVLQAIRRGKDPFMVLPGNCRNKHLQAVVLEYVKKPA